jgi:hypothetical protein
MGLVDNEIKKADYREIRCTLKFELKFLKLNDKSY